MKSIADLKRETKQLVRVEHEKRLDRDARAERDGLILNAFDRLSRGESAASDEQPAPHHAPHLEVLP